MKTDEKVCVDSCRKNAVMHDTCTNFTCQFPNSFFKFLLDFKILTFLETQVQ